MDRYNNLNESTLKITRDPRRDGGGDNARVDKNGGAAKSRNYAWTAGRLDGDETSFARW